LLTWWRLCRFVCSSIDGRIASEWIDPSSEAQKNKFAFKSHRGKTPEGTDLIYPVNALVYHPM